MNANKTATANFELKPVVSFAATTSSVWERGGAATGHTLTVNRDKTYTQAMTVQYTTYIGTGTVATAGQDYVSATGTVTFQPGDPNTKTISLQIVDDTVIEDGLENFFVLLSNPVNCYVPPFTVNVVTIQDDDPEAAFTISVTGQGTTNPPAGVQYFAKYNPTTSKACRELWAQGYGSGTCTELYNSNVQITATPAAGWAFYRWWGDVYANEAQATVSVDTSMSRVIKAEFVSRPGISSLDLVADLTTFLAQGNIRDGAGNLYTAANFDRNEIDYDENSEPVFVGNGILDAAELALVQAVLKNAALDLSARGGITADGVWAAWQTNIARARLDMVAQSAAVQNVVAGYMTLGDYKSVECIKDLVSRAPFSVTLDETPYNRSRQRFFYWKYDPDGDGLDNLDEWTYASPAGQVTTLAQLSTFLTQSLNGAANAQADGSKGLALGGTADCPCAATTTVTLGTPENGTITVDPLGVQPYSEKLKVTAKPDPSYTFLGYSTTPATLLSGSKELEMTFSLTAPLSATVNVTGVFWRSYLEVPLNPTSYSITVTGENTVTVDVPEENARRIYGPRNTELKVTLTTTASTTPKLVGVEIDYGLTHEAPGFSWQKTFTVVLPEFGRISVQGSFGQTPAETVSFSLESNQGGTVLGAETFSGQTKFSERITVQKDGPVQFYAVPNPGFEHTGWESLPTSQTGGAVRARFEEIKKWKLGVETAGPDTPCSGYVSVVKEFFGLPNNVNNARAFYNDGESLALVAKANPGYRFVRWEHYEPNFIAFPNSSNEAIVTMAEDIIETAVFEKVNVYAIILSGEQPGGAREPAAIGSGVFTWASNKLESDNFDVHMYDEDYVEADGSGKVFNELVAKLNSTDDTGATTYIVMVGHSHGGGSIADLCARIAANPGNAIHHTDRYKILMTAYVDAIDNSSDTSVDAETEFPVGSQHHVNLYQNIDEYVFSLPDGGPVTGADPNWNVNETPKLPCVSGVDHMAIDDNGNVHRVLTDRVFLHTSPILCVDDELDSDYCN